ncbi:SOS response-associated peptidase family protein [Citrobacter sp. RHB25-C09]|uniref:SOS response-associated peptidase family protein n=1 Tax=Citrobacter sp. RHB25-C09 TaxID=2742624 RepID=UPI0015EEE5D7|nr:SOS response-associated peptidase family protein [Citrobacter sp. RHB25-C09]QMI04918.1 SOS response-associated peptidase family protein [Citrobacter sp. RHB25-C09]
MCGRFTQAQTREEYLAYLANEANRNIAYDPEPIGRYNVAPGTKVLLLSERDEQLHLDPVLWGYAPGWWDKQTLINARVETAAADKGLVDIHDRRPLVLSPEAAREWMRQNVGGKEAGEIAVDGAVPVNKFIWHAVTRAVGNVKNQGPELIQSTNYAC